MNAPAPEHDPRINQRLITKLNPERFPNMSLEMAAIMGYLLDQPYTTPAIVELRITPDEFVIGRTDDQMKSFHLGEAADLRANLRRLGMAAELNDVEWAEFLDLAYRKLGTRIDESAP